ncbi:glucose 1-dehydrogenase [Exophiala viscosa]|uniref:glucose 1-dehydrogenase n=1 Tax=Exophiala viscosa TaxID=2486360 RepID=UPI00218F454A|nr:glucose 1-dehydrogenase [Exophiala viscosa]
MKKVLVGYGIDVDAVAGWIDTKDGSRADPVEISRGMFGALVGVDRLLKLLATHNIKASWYIPAHTLETFPVQVSRIVDGGHEIGFHGYSHEYVSQLSEQQERDVLRKSIDVFMAFTGKKPTGWTAPAFTTSSRTVHLLEEMGIQYDHSFMHHDCQLYMTPYSDYGAVTTAYQGDHNSTRNASDWMKRMPNPKISTLVTVPANWHLDDWPPFSPGDNSSNGFIDPYVVEKMWKEHFEYCYEEYDEFVFPLSIHPQISGTPQIIKMHQRLIEWVNGFDGVEWCTFEEMVAQYKRGLISGFNVEKAMGISEERYPTERK